MWDVLEHRKVAKSLAAAPVEVRKRYEKWKDIVAIRGFNDEALSGKWKGFRSSRLNIQYRVIYQVHRDQVLVQVEKVTPHDYGRQ